jgi:hypothetical protein
MCWFSVKWRTGVPVSEYTAFFGDQLGDIARRKWRLLNWALAETATGFKKGKNTLGGRRSHSPRGWKKQTG